MVSRKGVFSHDFPLEFSMPSGKHTKNAVKLPFISYLLYFPIQNVDFPIQNLDFPLKKLDLPIKNADFPWFSVTVYPRG